MKSDSKVKSYTGNRNDIISIIEREPKRVLDVGCSDGSLGYALKNRYNSVEVHGIEFDPEYVKVARTRLAAVTQADLNNFDHSSLPRDVDLLIFADVLEHTVQPGEVLKKILECFGNSDTEIIVSVPNAQHITVILNLMLGRWPERDRGIFDRTHLRWFTLRSIEKLAGQNKFEIARVKRNYRIFDQPGGRLNRIARFCHYFPFKNFFTYQYVILLRRHK